jgi:RNA ligase
MNFYKYIGCTPEHFESHYIAQKLVVRQSHDTFPLDIYVYGREAEFGGIWDYVTSKCRGIIVNRLTGDIVARPFEKFHNLGSPHAAQIPLKGQPAIMEKVDGFMCTLYTWEHKQYIASKGSFHSVHAKWATQWLRARFGDNGFALPPGYTAVFEGLHKDLRIVVDYGDRQGLVLLAVIHNETGVEMWPYYVESWAAQNSIECAKQHDLTLERARQESLVEYRDNLGTEEGYVATWYNTGGEYRPPVRLKIKFIDYLRLHRMVTGVNPHHIWEALANDQKSQMSDWLNRNNSTPWFESFVSKWQKVLVGEKERMTKEATAAFDAAVAAVGVRPDWTVEWDCIPYRRDLSPAELAVRKAFAREFTRPENKKYSTALFKMLDKQDPSMALWKYVEPMTKGIAPLRIDR